MSVGPQPAGGGSSPVTSLAAAGPLQSSPSKTHLRHLTHGSAPAQGGPPSEAATGSEWRIGDSQAGLAPRRAPAPTRRILEGGATFARPWPASPWGLPEVSARSWAAAHRDQEEPPMYPSQEAPEIAILMKTSRELDVCGDVTVTVDNPSELVAWASVLVDPAI